MRIDIACDYCLDRRSLEARVARWHGQLVAAKSRQALLEAALVALAAALTLII